MPERTSLGLLPVVVKDENGETVAVSTFGEVIIANDLSLDEAEELRSTSHLRIGGGAAPIFDLHVRI